MSLQRTATADLPLDRQEAFRRLEAVTGLMARMPIFEPGDDDQTLKRWLGIGPGFAVVVTRRHEPDRLVLASNQGRIRLKVDIRLQPAAGSTVAEVTVRVEPRGPIGWILFAIGRRIEPNADREFAKAVDEAVLEAARDLGRQTAVEFDADIAEARLPGNLGSVGSKGTASTS